SNDQAVPVRFEAELGREEDMRITSRTPLAERDGFQLWTATIPANGRVTLRYRQERTSPR
ncbi:MAG TPA: hypothetical protein VGB54_00650, partial [Allosphingosinicella sp.]